MWLESVDGVGGLFAPIAAHESRYNFEWKKRHE
jgi:hypothetical protein